jgi:ribosomal protein S4
LCARPWRARIATPCGDRQVQPHHARLKEGIGKVLRDNMEQVGSHNAPNWLEWNPSQLTGKVNALPTPEDVPFEVNMNLIIEFYR